MRRRYHGPATVWENSLVKTSAYIGPYRSIDNNVVIKRGEIENSVLMDNSYIEIAEKITDSFTGPYSRVTTNQSGRL